MLSCKAQKEGQSISGEEMKDLVLIAQDHYSGILEYDTQVIKDAKSLHKFYAQINKTRKPGLPVPVIDFSKETVIVICMGQQKGEIEPKLSKTEESESNIIIAVELLKNNDFKKDVNASIFHSFYVYKIPNTSKKIDFQKLGW